MHILRGASFFRVSSWFSLALLALVSSGCGESKEAVVPVKGQLTLDGQPFGPANLLFTPKAGLNKGKQGSGAADASGNITFSSYANGDGLPAGDYQVIIVPPPGGSDKIPQIYTDEKNSPLTAKVEAQSTSVKVDLLSSAGPPAMMGGGIQGAMDPAAMLKNSMPASAQGTK